jgi:putative ABC transport system permease protein
VRRVASVTQLPTPDMSRNLLVIEGRKLEGDGPTFIPYASVSDEYFRTMGVSLKSGRTFGAMDHADATNAIVISESMAHRYWPNGGAIGTRIQISPLTSERWGEIVGIVADVRLHPTEPELDLMAYASTRQDAMRGNRTFVVRTSGDPLALVAPIQRELSALDPEVPLRDPITLRDLLDGSLAGRRLPVMLMAAFGVLALILASVGVYAMFATMAAAREREFGVRIALGSTRAEIAHLVFRQGALWMLVGLAGGALGITVVARLLRDLLYGVSPFDPLAIAAAVLALLLCATVALLVPIRRATRVDPITVLR